MMNLLVEIIQGNISKDEGEEIILRAIDDYHSQKIKIEWWKYLGLDKYEMTAYAFGGNLQDLLFLRINGWPEKCTKCGYPIHYQEFGWRLIHKDNSSPLLWHLECPNRS